MQVGIIFIAFFVAIFCVSNARAETGQSFFVLHVSVSNLGDKAKGPIAILSLRNSDTAPHEASGALDPSVGECDYATHVESRQGIEPALGVRQKALRGLSNQHPIVVICDAGRKLLAPGEEIVETIDLSKNFKLVSGQVYKFWVVRNPDWPDKNTAQPTSNVVTFVAP